MGTSMRALLIGVALGVAATSAAAKDLHLAAHLGPDQTLAYVEGKPVIQSEKMAHSGAALLIQSERFDPKQYPALGLRVTNLTDLPVNFGPESVVATTDAGPVEILTEGDIEAMARDAVARANRAATWMRIGAALSAAGASMPRTTTFSGSAFNSYGGSSFYSGAISTPSNGAESGAILANGAAQAEAAQAKGQAEAAQLSAAAEERGFRPATIAPHGEATTALTLGHLPKKATLLKVAVTLNGETHVFEFAVSPVS